ncbi:hypothetical protein ACLK1T_19775 [Escherichia coli]
MVMYSSYHSSRSASRYMLGAKETFFYKLVGPLIDVISSAGEDLKRRRRRLSRC